MAPRFFVFAFGAQHTGEEIVGACETGRNFKRAFKNSPPAFDVPFLHSHTSKIDPTIGISGINPGYLLECLPSALEIALQEEANPVIVPARPVVRLQFHSRDSRRRVC